MLREQCLCLQWDWGGIFPQQLCITSERSPKRLLKARYFLFFFLFLQIPCLLSATTYYSRVATGTFGTASTWSTSRTGTPTNATALTSADIFIIQTGNTINVAAAPSYASITVESGGGLTVGGSYTWNVPIININSGATWNISTRTCTMNGSTITNNGTISGTTAQLTLSTAGTSFTNNGSFSLSTGRLNVNAGTCSNAGTISYSSTGRLIFTTGTLTNEATGSITYATSGTFTLSTGNLYNNNTNTSVNFGSTAITISGTAVTQNMGGFKTTGGFACSKTSGTLTLSGDVNCSTITKSGAGTLDLGTGNIISPTGLFALGTAGTVNGNTSTIVITNATAFSGTAAIYSQGTSTVNLSLAGNQSLGISGLSFYNFTLSGSGTKTITSCTVNNILSMEGTSTASVAPTYGGSATLQYNTATARTAGVEWISPFVASGGVIIANTGAISSGGAKVFNTSSPLTINSGATLTTGANAFTFNGDLINNGTWTASTGAITITGTATQSIGIFNTTGTVSMTKTGGTATFTGGENGGGFTLNGSGGTLDLGTGLTHTFSGTWTNTAGILLGNTSTLNIGGTSTGTGSSFTANTSTVNFTSASVQSIPAFTYYDVNFSGTGIKTLSGTTGSSHVLTINASSELDLSSMTLNLSGSGTPLVNNGIFTASTSTVNYTNTGATVITGVNYNNLNGTGGNRTLSTTAAIGIAGSFTAGAGTYTVTNSTVDFNGGAAQTIPAFTFYYLNVSNAGIKSILAGTTVACQTLAINNAAQVEINADGGAILNVLQ